MNFDNLVSGNIGLVHLLFSMIALVLGTLVLIKSKGTQSHKKVGYLYCIAMLGVNITAFMMYRLFGKFGMFHWMAVVSLLTLVIGMLPMFLKKPKSYITRHYNCMYWSVFGLYGAFMAETFLRLPDVVVESGIPNTTFYNMVGVSVGITMGIGVLISIKKRKVWSKFDKSLEKNR